MAVYTGMNFVAGFIGDSLGIRRTLYISVVLLVVSRLVISATTERAIVIPALFVIAVGTAIMTPILIAATKRYTTESSQTAGFNLLYFLMNIGAFLGNVAIDPLRKLEWGNRSVFMLGSAVSILCWISILIFWRKGLARVDRIVEDGKAEAEEAKWEAPWTIAASVMRESAFWRFMLLLMLLVGVRLVFEHQSQIYPKYYLRTMSELLFTASPSNAEELDRTGVPPEMRAALDRADLALADGAMVFVEQPGERWRVQSDDNTIIVRLDGDQLKVYGANVPIGKLNSINPFIIVFGVILSTPIVARFKLFHVMFVGICISAVSMLVLAIYPGWFIQTFGMTLAQGYLAIALAQIVIFSIGEVIWSPRLYEYTAAVAPTGREASYMGLSYLPMTFARFAEGPLAGTLLTEYCPPDVTDRLTTVPYSRSPQMMHLILAGIAIATPVLILVFRKVIRKEAKGRV
jgi:MFS family permease